MQRQQQQQHTHVNELSPVESVHSRCTAAAADVVWQPDTQRPRRTNKAIRVAFPVCVVWCWPPTEVGGRRQSPPRPPPQLTPHTANQTDRPAGRNAVHIAQIEMTARTWPDPHASTTFLSLLANARARMHARVPVYWMCHACTRGKTTSALACTNTHTHGKPPASKTAADTSAPEIVCGFSRKCTKPCSPVTTAPAPPSVAVTGGVLPCEVHNGQAGLWGVLLGWPVKNLNRTNQPMLRLLFIL